MRALVAVAVLVSACSRTNAAAANTSPARHPAASPRPTSALAAIPSTRAASSSRRTPARTPIRRPTTPSPSPPRKPRPTIRSPSPPRTIRRRSRRRSLTSSIRSCLPPSTWPASISAPSTWPARPPACRRSVSRGAQCTPAVGLRLRCAARRLPPRRSGQRLHALPATGYAPIVAEVPVTSNGEGCQSIKSSATLVTTSDVVVDTVPPKFPIPNAKPTGVPDGRFLAWAIVDPAPRSASRRAPRSGERPRPQKIGCSITIF